MALRTGQLSAPGEALHLCTQTAYIRMRNDIALILELNIRGEFLLLNHPDLKPTGATPISS